MEYLFLSPIPYLLNNYLSIQNLPLTLTELFVKSLLEVQVDYIHCISFIQLATDCFQKLQ